MLISSTVLMEVNRISSNYDSVAGPTEEMLLQVKKDLLSPPAEPAE